MASPPVRSAGPSDIDDVAEVEIGAGRLVHTVGMSQIAAHVPDREALRRRQEQGLTWLAEQHGVIAGYIVATVLDGNAHIEQVSVAPAYARQGTGRRLEAAMDRERSLQGMDASRRCAMIKWHGDPPARH